MKMDSADELKKGWKLDEELAEIMEKRKDNRELLRLMNANNGLNEKEKAELLELYPVRERKAKDEDTDDTTVVDEDE